MPEDIMGDIPSSIKVPRLLANIILSQYKGSDVSEDTIPYNLMKLIARQCYKTDMVNLEKLTAFGS